MRRKRLANHEWCRRRTELVLLRHGVNHRDWPIPERPLWIVEQGMRTLESHADTLQSGMGASSRPEPVGDPAPPTILIVPSRQQQFPSSLERLDSLHVDEAIVVPTRRTMDACYNISVPSDEVAERCTGAGLAQKDVDGDAVQHLVVETSEADIQWCLSNTLSLHLGAQSVPRRARQARRRPWCCGKRIARPVRGVTTHP
jgi:hypothetical protein